MPVETLLIEDRPVIRENLIPVLREVAEVEVTATAETAFDALKIAKASSTWRLMVLDLFLKQGNGLMVLDSLRGRRPGQVICVLTNYATVAMREKCALMGADAVFDKSTELDGFFEFCAAVAPD